MLLGAVLCSVALLLSRVDAQDPTSPPFQWAFAGSQAYSQSLPSCRTFPITITPLTIHGIPPFYMIAYPIGQAPTTSFIGKNGSALSWQVRHPIGTRLLLSVFDSNGTSGGVDPLIYNVTAGSSTQCLPPADTEPPFTITANVTDALTTCQPWGLTVRGGTPPYNVTLAALNAPVVTNVTLGPGDSVLTYINRADPGTQMIAAASDLTGRWATGTPIVRTQGSKDVNCTGLDTSTGPLGPPSAPPARSNSRRRLGIILGVILGTLLLLLLCGLGHLWALRRRRQRQQQKQSEKDDGTTRIVHHQHDSDSGVLDISPFRTEPGDSWYASGTPPVPSKHSEAMRHSHTGTFTPTGSSVNAGSTTASPSVVASGSSKSATLRHMASFTNTAASGSASASTPSPTSDAGSPPVRVRELPPPYAVEGN